MLWCCDAANQYLYGLERSCTNRGECDEDTGVCECDGDEYSGEDCGTERCNGRVTCLSGGECVRDRRCVICVFRLPCLES